MPYFFLVPNLIIILSGDFNANFADERAQRLITFLKDKFQLHMTNDPQHSATNYGTTLDAVFSRFIEKMELERVISYFSYHKPIVSLIVEYNENDLQA
jgi:endonuclease/exonuclease/phosphatase (EEP) superfamily protein YafD